MVSPPPLQPPNTRTPIKGIQLLNFQYNSYRSNSTPELVLLHHRSARGRYGDRQGPLLRHTSILNFISIKRNSTRARIPAFLKKVITIFNRCIGINFFSRYGIYQLFP